ncbi:hypothetical protein [Salinibaculum rarum]|uniref:hypothetical protein n=1 Tax=Salinibaculum rarum TaxID=3058903 RepID=UPI00265EA3C1|nr:hypothetical protein [Salinibaculum sp. KK48]
MTDIPRTPHATPPEFVLCFDRDYTVDVNPPRDRQAVPLQWVKYFAHSPDTQHIDVWATGNQHLVSEAGIPGIRTAKALWDTVNIPDVEETFDKPHDENGEEISTYKPDRREGLRMIKDIYDPVEGVAPSFVVVDDANLIALESEGWSYYQPWDFVAAIGDNTAEVTVPESHGFCNQPVISNNCTCNTAFEKSFFDPRKFRANRSEI